MASAQDVLKIARSQIGVKESPKGSNNVKYNTAYYGRPVHSSAYAWCVVGLWWCFRQAGLGESVFPKTASTGVRAPGLMQWAKREGRWFTGKPKVGDIVVFSYSHVGIVEKAHGRRNVSTIEFNTDDSGSRTGGQVMRKRRTSSILGYFRPNYGKASPSTPPASNTGGVLGMAHKGYIIEPMKVAKGDRKTVVLRKGKDKTGYAIGAGMESFAVDTELQLAPGFTGNLQVRYFIVHPAPKLSETLKRGSTGADVEKLQRLIGTAVDGDFGPNTEKALKAYEQAHGMTVNGVVGPEQWKRLFPDEATYPYKPQEFKASPGNTFAVATKVGECQGHLRVSVVADQDFELKGGRVDLLHG